MENSISCDAHDYFEIVCMRKSRIIVTTYDNKKYHGIAHNISTVKKQEVLVIKERNRLDSVLLTEVKALQATGNAVAQHNFCITLR